MQALTTGHHDDESARESQAGFALLAEALERQLLTIKEQAALLEVAQEAILVRELGGTIVFWNRAAEQLYGWGREEAVDNVTHAILATDFPKPFEDILAELRDTGRWEGELVHRRRDGTRIVVASRWVLCRREDEPDPLVLETNTDVTERRQAEAACARARSGSGRCSNPPRWASRWWGWTASWRIRTEPLPSCLDSIGRTSCGAAPSSSWRIRRTERMTECSSTSWSRRLAGATRWTSGS
jgi:PAS domain S-box-containing protein